MNELRGLDAWITRAPEYSKQLITQNNFAELVGDDLQINELKCAWSGKVVGYHDYEDGNDQLHLAFTNYYQLDEDGEVLVDAESFDDDEARSEARERQIDRECKESRSLHHDE